ncbi:uncharacterized protein [Amphiura filiformis]|uniref:uncharacterized protein n=1 Tax=Amphiura filiformis TaxID=82378 RepID=UPI003B216FDC
MDDMKENVPTSPKKLTMGDDEADGGKLVLEEDPYKVEANKHFESWPEDLKAKDVAKMSMVYLHSGHISRDPKSRRGTLTVKPLEVTIVNLSKKTTLHLGASFFKSGRFAVQQQGAIGVGESHTYSISSKDGRAKTGVKGGLAFIVYDIEEEFEEPEEKQDEENGEKKKKKKEKKEKKKKERKEKKKSKKEKKNEGGEEEKENKEAEEGEEKEEDHAEDVPDGEEKPAEENQEGEGGEENSENVDEEKKDNISTTGEGEHKEDEELPDGNGDFFICGFENPLAGNPKAKCNKTDSKDIAPLLKQLKMINQVSRNCLDITSKVKGILYSSGKMMICNGRQYCDEILLI